MKQPVKIQLILKDSISSIFFGSIEHTDDGFIIEYEEPAGGTCIVGYSGDVVSITHTGEPNYTMLLEKNNTHAFIVNTPFGDVTATARPEKIRHKFDDTKTSLFIVYDLSLGVFESRREFILKTEIIKNEE